MNSKLDGLFIYIDKKNRYIYKDFFSKSAYVIDKNSISVFKRYQNRYLIALALVALGYNFIFDVKTWVIIALGVLVILETLFRVKFLKSLEKVDTQKLKLSNKLDKISVGRTRILSVLYLALGVLLIVNAIMEKLDTTAFILSVIAAGIAFTRFSWSVSKLVKGGK